MKSLIVFYSRTGNARFVAQTIAAEIGADTEELVDLKKRTGVIGWLRSGSDARRGKETELEPIAKSSVDYDLIVVGTPIWAGRPTPAVTTYLKKNDLAGKKVAAFFVKDGKKPEGVEQIRALVPNSDYLGEITVISALKKKEASESQVLNWCKTLVAT